MSELGDRGPNRHGSAWTRGELERLVAGIAQGCRVAELAEQLGRSESAIRHAARTLTPVTEEVATAAAVEWLRRRLEVEPDYDWMAAHCLQRPRSKLSRATTAASEPALATGAVRVPASQAPSGLDAVELTELLTAAIAPLAEDRLQTIIAGRLNLDGNGAATLAELGARLQLSRERIRQLQDKAASLLVRQAGYDGSAGQEFAAALNGHTLAVTDIEQVDKLLDIAADLFSGAGDPQVGVYLLLSAAGYQRNRAKGLAKLASKRLQQRAAARLEERRTHPERYGAEQRVVKWLADADWPRQLKAPPAKDELRAFRDVHIGEGGAGTVDSQKLGRKVAHESLLELEVVQALEHSRQVAYYQEQPAVIPYEYGGERHLYYPDFLAVTVDGHGLLIEVKGHWHAALTRNRAKAAAARASAHADGLGWVVVTDRGTYRDLIEQPIDEDVHSVLTRELHRRGYLTWDDMNTLRERYPLTHIAVAAYAVQHNAHLQLQPFMLSLRTF